MTTCITLIISSWNFPQGAILSMIAVFCSLHTFLQLRNEQNNKKFKWCMHLQTNAYLKRIINIFEVISSPGTNATIDPFYVEE